MKKSLISVCVMLLLAATIYSQQIEVIQEKEKISTLTIEFIPALDEARFIYSCPSALFEQANAIKMVKERAQLFTKERGYFFYTYIRPDVTRFDNTKNIATYTSFIKFLN